MSENMKKRLMVASSGLGAIALPVAVFAEEGSGTANAAVVSALTSTANDMMATGTSLVPVALGVVGLALAVRFGIRFFKQIAK